MDRKILVVDDEEDVRRIIRLPLIEAGFRVVEAEDGEKAIEILNFGDHPLTVEAIICDVRIPKINGVEAVTCFRRAYPLIPVIVLTGYPDLNLAVGFMKEGVVEYIVKPVERKRLLESVRKATAQRTLYREPGHHP